MLKIFPSVNHIRNVNVYGFNTYFNVSKLLRFEYFTNINYILAQRFFGIIYLRHIFFVPNVLDVEF